MANFEVQKMKAARKVVKAYKDFEECHQEKLTFVEPAFTEGIDDKRKRIFSLVSKYQPKFFG